MRPLATIDDQSLIIFISIAGAALVGVGLIGVLTLPALLKGGRRAASQIADPLQLPPGKSTHARAWKFGADVDAAAVLGRLTTHWQGQGADLLRQEAAATVLFLGLPREALVLGLNSVQQAPLRILAHVQQTDGNAVLHVRLDSDYLTWMKTPAGFAEIYQRAFNRVLAALEPELAALGVESTGAPEQAAAKGLLEQAQAESSVGMVLAEFSLSGMRRMGMVAIGAVVILLGATCFLAVLILAANFSPNPFTLMLGVGIGFGFLGAGVALVLRMIFQPRLRVIVGSDGVEQIDGADVRSCRWSDVQTVQEIYYLASFASQFWFGWLPVIWAMATGTRQLFVLTCRDGRRLQFGDFSGDLATLAEMIMAHTAPHLEPLARKTLDAGLDVPFGAIKINRRGISGPSGAVLSWTAVGDVAAEEGWLNVKESGAWLNTWSVPIRDVPNPHVLLALAEELRQGAAPQSH